MLCCDLNLIVYLQCVNAARHCKVRVGDPSQTLSGYCEYITHLEKILCIIALRVLTFNE
jgi:hypothetical protein